MVEDVAVVLHESFLLLRPTLLLYHVFEFLVLIRMSLQLGYELDSECTLKNLRTVAQDIHVIALGSFKFPVLFVYDGQVLIQNDLHQFFLFIFDHGKV